MNDNPENSNQPPIAQLIVVTVAIASIAAILLQNLQPLVKIYFLGQATITMPLSVAILAAFLIGVVMAAIVNAIANLINRDNPVSNVTNPNPPNTSSNKAASVDASVKDKPQSTPKRAIQDDDDDRYTDYPRSGRKTTIQDDDYEDNEDDDGRDEIFVKYIRK